jgi:hypothetical protein
LAECELEIMARSEGLAVGRSEQVTCAYSAGVRWPARVDVADEEAHERRQPDRAALLERDRRIVYDETELCSEMVVSTVVLERVQECAQESAELVAFGLAEPGQQLLGVGQVLGRARLEELTSPICEGHQRAAAVVWVGIPFGEPALDEPVDPQTHGSGGQPEL